MGILGWIIMGLIAGAIAKAVHKGNEPGGLLGTLAVGIVGAIVGGLIGSAIGVGGISSFFSLGTWLLAIGGALLLLLVYSALTGGDRSRRAGRSTPPRALRRGSGAASMRSPIVCGIDGSRTSHAAARLASILADRADRPLELLHVSDLRDETERTSRARALHEGLVSAREPGGDTIFRVQRGCTQQRLVEASRRASLVVIGTRSAGPVRRAIIGSTAAAVTRAAAAPVLIVPRPAAARQDDDLRGGILCAVEDGRDLATCATAACWARELEVPLTLVHVLPPQRLPTIPAGVAPPAGLVPGFPEQVADARAMLAEIEAAITPCAPIACRTRLLHGIAGPELAEFAAAENAGIIAVGPRTSTSFARVLSRSVTPHLLRRAPCPVMACPSPEAVLRLSGAGEDGERAAGGRITH